MVRNILTTRCSLQRNLIVWLTRKQKRKQLKAQKNRITQDVLHLMIHLLFIFYLSSTHECVVLFPKFVPLTEVVIVAFIYI